jgi:hypothetical protein
MQCSQGKCIHLHAFRSYTVLFALCARVVLLLSSLKGIESAVCHHDLASIHRRRIVILVVVVLGMQCSQGKCIHLHALRSYKVLLGPCARVVLLLSSLKGIESAVCHHDLASIHRRRIVILVQGMLCSQGKYIRSHAFRSLCVSNELGFRIGSWLELGFGLG